MANKEQEKKNMPIGKIRSGKVSATIWENEKEFDGEKVKINSITIVKNYKDKNDEWQETSSFNANDIMDLKIVAEQSYSFLKMKVEDNRKTEE